MEKINKKNNGLFTRLRQQLSGYLASLFDGRPIFIKTAGLVLFFLSFTYILIYLFFLAGRV